MDLADLVDGEEVRLRARYRELGEACAEFAGSRSLLGFTDFDQCHGTWRALARSILVEPARPLPPEAAPRLAVIGRRLLHED